MSNNDTGRFEQLQSRDTDDVGTALTNLQESRQKSHERKSRAKHESLVRRLITEAQGAIAGDSDHNPEDLLLALHWAIEQDPNLEDVLSPEYDGLESSVKSTFRDHENIRARGNTPPNPLRELETLLAIAIELEVIYGVEDPTWYEPVYFSKIDPAPGKASLPGTPTPVGRIRIGADEPIGAGDRRPVIEHKSCEHVLAIALPRQGKDSTNVSLCANLMNEHRYKWISLWDDGRDETNMIAIPNDEEPIQENLAEMNQGPQAYETAVYVPAMSGLPDELPGNFKPFTIGVDDLTGKMILRLGGFDADRNTINRVEQALAEAKRAKDSEVAVLVDRLETYAEEVEATVTITELADDDISDDDLDDGQELAHQDDHTEIRYEMDSDKVLHECAQTVLHLAAEGLLADSDAETNLDMTEIVRRNDRVATLNCNYLEDRNEPLKFVIANLWVRLLLRVRDKDKSLPRVALEIRELKQICPSTMQIVDYANEVKPLRQSLYEVATQGGSRRILMVGSTQKLNDVAKPVRTNMPYKIFLKLDNGLIKTMDDEMQFPYALKEQLKGFDPGQGALKVDENFYWPIWWRGAPCGLGDGDVPFERRYGQAYGFRVRAYENDAFLGEYDEDDVEWWVDQCGTAFPIDETPAVDQWYLLSVDFDEAVRPESLEREDVKAAAERRQEYPVPNDLTFQPTSVSGQTRSMRIERLEEARDRRMAEMMGGPTVPVQTDGGEVRDYKPPAVLREWLEFTQKKRQKLLHCLTDVEQNEFTSRRSLADHTGIPDGTLAEYLAERNTLGACLEKRDGVYKLTDIGETALEVQWSEIE